MTFTIFLSLLSFPFPLLQKPNIITHLLIFHSATFSLQHNQRSFNQIISMNYSQEIKTTIIQLASHTKEVYDILAFEIQVLQTEVIQNPSLRDNLAFLEAIGKLDVSKQKEIHDSLLILQTSSRVTRFFFFFLSFSFFFFLFFLSFLSFLPFFSFLFLLFLISSFSTRNKHRLHREVKVKKAP